MNICKSKVNFVGMDKYHTNKNFSPSEMYKFNRDESHHTIHIYMGVDNYAILTEYEFSKYFKVIKEEIFNNYS